MNFAEMIYKFATGQHRLDRVRNEEIEQMRADHAAERLQLYAGADLTQNRPTPNQLTSPEDFRPAYQRIILIRAARQMEEDMGFFDGILKDFENYVVGDLKYKAATGNPDANKAINDFLEWQFAQADITNRLDLPGIASLAVRSHKRDGEMGAVFVDDGESIRINYINGDRIGNPMIGTSIGPSNYNGIITDPESGTPISFEIFRRVPKLNTYVFQFAVRANDFRHVYDPFRFDQYHGVTSFKNAVEHAFDIKQTVDFTKLNIKWRASQLPYVQNEAGKPRGNGYKTAPAASDGTPRPFDVTVEGVTQSYLKLGEGVMEYPNDFPNQQFASLMDELRRECCTGAGLPIEFVFRAENGGVVQRFFVNKAETTFAREKRLLKRTLLEPYKNRVIQKGIDTGFLDLSAFGTLSTDLARFRGAWQMGKMVSVDYKNETTADLAQIDAGMMSEEEFASENNRDLEVVREQKAIHALAVFEDAMAISKKTGAPLDLVLPYVSKKFPNPGAGLAAGGEPKDTGTEDSPSGKP